ncbi:MAG TPA: 7-carboxy-7-deazaguanine synthase QueE [Fimbriimonadaceae bacterium]|nr:7-carboxy-7-deazaguanine synthase QueE [Fimbriimonadaceae bacterium]
MSEPRLRVAEVFTSLQGEGIWSGVPSTFVRVSGCNLRCSWCDTPYASWNPEGPVLPVSRIVEDVVERATRHVVLTGGEPMLFDGIEHLADLLKQAGHVITIETAGTVFRQVQCDLMSISPKLSNSTPDGPWQKRHEETRLKVDILRNLTKGYQHQMKFVVSSNRDWEEIEAILHEVPIDPSRVLIMPEGTDSETLWNRARELAPQIVARGFRLCPRLHVDLFGNTRGT